MNIIEELGRALDQHDWKIVARVYAHIENQEWYHNTPAKELNLDIEGIPNPKGKLVEQLEVSPPKKKRGRPRKVKEGDLIESGGQIGKVLPVSEDNDTVVSVDSDFKVHNRSSNKADGERRQAKLEPFRPPKGPNKFDPSTQVSEGDPDYERVNDNVRRTPRTRTEAVFESMVFCKDCGKNVLVPQNSSLCQTLERCEYAAVGKTDKCPYASKCGG